VPKALEIQDLDEDKDSLRTPLDRPRAAIRADSWEDAFELAATRLVRDPPRAREGTRWDHTSQSLREQYETAIYPPAFGGSRTRTATRDLVDRTEEGSSLHV